jgi:poly(3-hydroxybutyrate) depolymerase
MITVIAASCALSALTIFAIAADPTIAPPEVAVATPAAPSEDVVIRTGLALVSPSPRSASRSLVRRDPIEAQLVAGTFVTPKASDIPVPTNAAITAAPPATSGATPANATNRTPAPQPSVNAWIAINANADGVFQGEDGSALAGGWIYATVNSATERVMMLEASGHGTVFVNGEPRGGDPYSWGFVRVPVKLKAGTNEFLFSVSRGRLAAKLTPPPAAAFISTLDMLTPSLIAERDTQGPIGVVVVNASTQPLAGARIHIDSDLADSDEWVDLHVMPALTVKKVALPAGYSAQFAGPAGSKRSVQATLTARDGTVLGTAPIELTTVSSSDRRVVTRMSTVDGSAQYYAVVPSTAMMPSTENATASGDAKPGLLFSVHGAGVEATSQAAAYAPKKEAHVVCPTNRRPFGFDWEDWGRIDFTEAVAHARATLVNDPRRSWLTGHSMGGHGTWQLGAHFPSEFAAIAPSAGWVSFGSYVGATAAGSAAVGAAGGPEDPAAAMLLRAGRASDTLSIKENYLQQGVYVLHGDADDNVPVSEAREMFKQLAAISHPDFEYYERPGAGHWWGNECVDWAPLMQFLFRHTLPETKDMTRVRFQTVSPQVSQRDGWVRVLQQKKPFEVSSVDMVLDVAKRTVAGTTVNVKTLDLVVPIAMPVSGADATAASAGNASASASAASAPAQITVMLDNQAIVVPLTTDNPHLRFHREQGSADNIVWSLDPGCRDGSKPEPLPAHEKKPARGGPFKNAYAHGFVAVVGTNGDDAADALIMAKARYDADQWWVRGNGRFEILTDTAFDPKQYLGRNVVLYGNHDQNAAWSSLIGNSTSIDVRNGSFAGPTSRHTGEDIAAMFVLPRIDCDQGQVGVVAATGAVGMRAAMRTPIFSAGVGVPDLIAFRSAMLTDGATSIIEAGFFGNDWGVDTGTWMRR